MDDKQFIEQVTLLGWLGCYLLSFILFLAAVWVGNWRLTVTGVLLLIPGIIVMMIWGGKWHDWFENW